LSGCFATNWLVFVNKDGSGTISMEFSMEKSVIEMMQGFGGAGDDPPPSSSEEMIDDEAMRELAESMGEGVRFVSAEPIPENGVSIGYTALFEFDDISGVSIDPMAGAPSEEAEPEGGDSVYFDFDAGFIPRLTIRIDQDEDDEEGEEQEQNPEEAAMMASMMKPFLGGMAFTVAVEVDGSISSTNASFVDGSRVTIMDFDMGKILDNDALFSKVVASNSVSDKELQNDFIDAGIRVETQEKVTIEYR
jgi:hypothetical protein